MLYKVVHSTIFSARWRERTRVKMTIQKTRSISNHVYKSLWESAFCLALKKCCAFSQSTRPKSNGLPQCSVEIAIDWWIYIYIYIYTTYLEHGKTNKSHLKSPDFHMLLAEIRAEPYPLYPEGVQTPFFINSSARPICTHSRLMAMKIWDRCHFHLWSICVYNIYIYISIVWYSVCERICNRSCWV